MSVSINPFRILSIDGGGLRGVIPVNIIKKIEELTGRPIIESFDLFAGTSTGGLIVAALTVGDANRKAKYSIEKIEEIYKNHGKTIFPGASKFGGNLYRKAKNIYQPRFSDKGIQTVLEQYLCNQRLNECIKPVYITSFDLERYRPLFFTSRFINRTSKIYNKNTNINAKLIDICRATSAAPVYLPSYPFTFADESHNDYEPNCVDGGVYSNNPALNAYIEVASNLDDTLYVKPSFVHTADDIFILSIGTGKTIKTIDKRLSRKWGILNWGLPIVNVMMDGNSHAVHMQLESMLGYRYLRLNPNIDIRNSDMTNSSESNYQSLINQTNQYFENGQVISELKNFIRLAQL